MSHSRHHYSTLQLQTTRTCSYCTPRILP
ncbi:hypothetical protein CCACVL1_07161 [Corchorus capsularis]|uniref:Uncharacterized protein n=1 Tax=Corchorus capsularis TaxID=210143 RepID=A0A1R3J918_COCAP|nr:hypothetical protein CCACVL1_07161 [Corchorus capsularis]